MYWFSVIFFIQVTRLPSHTHVLFSFWLKLLTHECKLLTSDHPFRCLDMSKIFHFDDQGAGQLNKKVIFTWPLVKDNCLLWVYMYFILFDNSLLFQLSSTVWLWLGNPGYVIHGSPCATLARIFRKSIGAFQLWQILNNLNISTIL